MPGSGEGESFLAQGQYFAYVSALFQESFTGESLVFIFAESYIIDFSGIASPNRSREFLVFWMQRTTRHNINCSQYWLDGDDKQIICM